MSRMGELHAEMMDRHEQESADEVAQVFDCMTGLKSYLEPSLYQQIEAALGFGPALPRVSKATASTH